MSTKQENIDIDIMDNPLPGEPVSIGTGPPPAYPQLDKKLSGEQIKQVHYGEYGESVFSITSPPLNHPPAQFGSRAHLAYCPTCCAQHVSRVDYQSTVMAHIMGVILCCTMCSCCLPYLFKSCKTARHYCPQCDTYLGAQIK